MAEFSEVALDDFEDLSAAAPEEEFVFYRDSHQSYDGEYYPSDTWSGKKVLFQSKDWGMTVELFVKILGRRVIGRLRPFCYYSVVRMRSYGAHEWNQETHKCTSLKDVARQLEGKIFDDGVKSAIKGFYRRERASCIYRKVDGAWVPYCTSFEPWTDMDNFPPGEFAGIRKDYWWKPEEERIYISGYTNSGGFKSSGNLKGSADGIVYWIGN